MGAIQKSVQLEKTDIGTIDSLEHTICSYVVEEKYEKAIDALEQYVKNETQYPKFYARVERLIQHSKDLVLAIRAKRSFPGMQSLTTAKQQELMEKYKEHFEELKEVLKKIEKVKSDLKMEDLRSTVWVVKAFINALFAIAVVAFFVELYKGLAQTGIVVIDDTFTKLVDWIFDLIGF